MKQHGGRWGGFLALRSCPARAQHTPKRLGRKTKQASFSETQKKKNCRVSLVFHKGEERRQKGAVGEGGTTKSPNYEIVV